MLQHVERFTTSDINLTAISHKIRNTVFVIEQHVPQEIEYDDFEASSRHYLLFINGLAVATCRWRETGKGIKLERFAVLCAHRGKGFGGLLVAEVLKDVKSLNNKIYLHAQEQVIPFYETFGFEATGPVFEEAGIRHRLMVLTNR